MSFEARTSLAQAAVAAMMARMTPAERADMVRWVNVTWTKAETDLPELQHRDREILRLNAEGLGARAISEIIHCSYTTVSRDLRGLQAKLGATSPAHLTVIAARAGLL